MPDFLLELLTEEIPARMQPRAAEDLGRLVGDALGKRGLNASVETHVTPRRLALFARDLPVETPATREERRGPRADAPPQAIEGFLRSTGLTRDALQERADPKGRFLYAILEAPGRPTAEVLPSVVQDAVAALPWPKSMRWGEASLSMDAPRWVRPLTGIVALLGDAVVPLAVLGVASGRTTRGHRFMGPREPIAITSPATYAAQLRGSFVLVDAAERRQIIAEGARAAAAAAGLVLIEDEGLVAENAGLTEWPVPLLGHFDPAFLEVPREVIQLTMRTNQKYFALTYPPLSQAGEEDPAQRGGGVADAAGSRATPGALAPAFICIANIAAPDGGATIIEGNRRVLAARLSDARFFLEQDLAEWRAAAANGPDGLWEHFAPKLERVIFHEKLGTMRDKAERVAKLARWLVESGTILPTPAVVPDLFLTEAYSALQVSTSLEQTEADKQGERHKLADLAERAAYLAKVDLVSAAVRELPELQGVMGAHYAKAAGEIEAVTSAVRNHYQPVGPSDLVPTDPVTVAISLADKIDALLGLAMAGEQASGSRDPYGLRRAAIGILNVAFNNRLRLKISSVTYEWVKHIATVGHMWTQNYEDLIRFDPSHKSDSRVIAFFKADFEDYSSESELSPREYFKLLPLNFSREGWDDFDYVFVAEHENVNTRKTYSFDNPNMSFPYVSYEIVESARGQSLALLKFLADRLKIQQRAAGIRHDLIDAVHAIREDDFVRLVARVRSLQNFLMSQLGQDFFIAFRRAYNLLVLESRTEYLDAGDSDALIQETYAWLTINDYSQRATDAAVTRCDAALEAALSEALPAATAAIEAEDFEGAMTVLSTLRTPIDAFFENVMVNDPDQQIRHARLSLLARFIVVTHAVADFSKIKG